MHRNKYEDKHNADFSLSTFKFVWMVHWDNKKKKKSKEPIFPSGEK